MCWHTCQHGGAAALPLQAHRHAGRREERYLFVSLERLLDDFFTDVDALRKP
jgi:hypothetical protein